MIAVLLDEIGHEPSWRGEFSFAVFWALLKIMTPYEKLKFQNLITKYTDGDAEYFWKVWQSEAWWKIINQIGGPIPQVTFILYFFLVQKSISTIKIVCLFLGNSEISF